MVQVLPHEVYTDTPERGVYLSKGRALRQQVLHARPRGGVDGAPRGESQGVGRARVRPPPPVIQVRTADHMLVPPRIPHTTPTASYPVETPTDKRTGQKEAGGGQGVERKNGKNQTDITPNTLHPPPVPQLTLPLPPSLPRDAGVQQELTRAAKGMMRAVANILRQAGAYVERPRPPKPMRHRATCEEQRAIQVRKAAFVRLRRLVRPVEQQDAPAEEVCRAYEAYQKAAEAVRALRRNQGRTTRRWWLRRLAAQLRNPSDKRQGFRTIRLQLSDTPRYPPARNVTRMDRTGITTCGQEAAEQFRVYFSILAQDQEDKRSRLTQENLRFWHERLKTWQTAVTSLTFPTTPFRTGPETSRAPDRSNWATKPLGSPDDPVTREEVTDTSERDALRKGGRPGPVPL